MHVELRLLPPMRLAYMRCTGPYGDPAIEQTWQRFAAWHQQHGLHASQRTLLGIYQDRPAITPPEQCRYDCCVEVAEDFMPSTEVALQDFAGGRYVCGYFSGDTADIHAAWAHLSDTWLPGLTADGAWRLGKTARLELYPEGGRLNAATEAPPCWLCLPIRAA
jgi:AraC family transcriptional regulator